jgi:hypothetical protein
MLTISSTRINARVDTSDHLHAHPSKMVSFFIFLKRESWWWLFRTAETCSFLGYYNKVFCMDGLFYCLRPHLPSAFYHFPVQHLFYLFSPLVFLFIIKLFHVLRTVSSLSSSVTCSRHSARTYYLLLAPFNFAWSTSQVKPFAVIPG